MHSGTCPLRHRLRSARLACGELVEPSNARPELVEWVEGLVLSSAKGQLADKPKQLKDEMTTNFITAPDLR